MPGGSHKYEKDADFEAALNAKFEEIGDFAKSAFLRMQQLAGGSADAANHMADALQRKALYTLSTEAPTTIDKQTTIKEIRDSQINDWTGPAADAFRTYLTTLERCLQNQYDFLLALRGLIECKRDLHYAKREGLIQICDQTIANEEIQAEQALRDSLSNAVGTYLAVGKSILAGAGPVGMAAEVMGFLGSYIVQQLASPGFGGMGPDVGSMLEATEQLRSYVTQEQTEINKGIATLTDLKDSFIERLIPPDVGSVTLRQ